MDIATLPLIMISEFRTHPLSLDRADPNKGFFRWEAPVLLHLFKLQANCHEANDAQVCAPSQGERAIRTILAGRSAADQCILS